jgi:UDP-3-O-[3-hydroxymyristoyl] glucosamine N-acyltransferase
MSGISIRGLAETVGGTVVGRDDVFITGAASITDAVPGDIVLAENPKYFEAAERSNATAIVTSDDSQGAKPVIRVKDARYAFAQILQILTPRTSRPVAGIDSNCRVGDRVTVAESSSVGYGSYIGDDVTIGEGAIIHPLVFIGDGVRIGPDSEVHPNVTIYHGTEIGARVVIHSGTVIGGDGFGYLPVGDEICKIPQIGKVIIEDDVEIGSNVTIDRAKTGATRIGRGTKIDNLVMIAHNCKIGQMCMIISQVGIAGSAEIGNGVVIAGQAGINSHIKIGDGAQVGGQSGVFGDLAPGGVYSGYPARPHREQLRVQAAVQRLPDTQKTVEQLKKEVERLSRRLQQLDGGVSGAESE